LRRVEGLPSPKVPDELLEVEAEYYRLKGEIGKKEARGVSEEELAEDLARLARLEYRYRELLRQYLG
jgi:hypothetical protein